MGDHHHHLPVYLDYTANPPAAATSPLEEQQQRQQVPSSTAASSTALSPLKASLLSAGRTDTFSITTTNSQRQPPLPPPPPPFTCPSSSSSSSVSASPSSNRRAGLDTALALQLVSCDGDSDNDKDDVDCDQYQLESYSNPSGRASSSASASSHDKSNNVNVNSSNNNDHDDDPPPPYSEGSSPLDSFSYIMAAAGGAASILTQVQQVNPAIASSEGSEPPGDEQLLLDLRGTRFTLTRDELLTLPEFILLSLFPSGGLPESSYISPTEQEVHSVEFDAASLQYLLDFFHNVASTISSRPSTPLWQSPSDLQLDNSSSSDIGVNAGSRDMLQGRAGIIVLREDLDFYVIPPRPDITHPEMLEVKREAAKVLLQQDEIFSGLKESSEVGSTEQHLIDMLTSGGFSKNARWGRRSLEPKKAVICSLALAKLKTEPVDENGGANSGNGAGLNAKGMAQKLLLFWRKPARRCWWEGVQLDGIEGVEGSLKVWIRRVWTLEMSVIGLR